MYVFGMQVLKKKKESIVTIDTHRSLMQALQLCYERGMLAYYRCRSVKVRR